MWLNDEYAVRTDIKVDLKKLRDAYLDLSERHIDKTAFRTGNDQRSDEAPNRVAGWGWRLYDKIEGEEGLHEDFAYLKPNDYCYGYIRHILNLFPEAFKPTLWTLPPTFVYNYHTDVPKDSYRMHIAIDTNNDCTHIWKDDEGERVYHMPADGHVWIICTSVPHTAKNDGGRNRTHLYWRMPIETLAEYTNVHATIA